MASIIHTYIHPSIDHQPIANIILFIGTHPTGCTYHIYAEEAHTVAGVEKEYVAYLEVGCIYICGDEQEIVSRKSFLRINGIYNAPLLAAR